MSPDLLLELQDHRQMQEARLIWRLLSMCRTAAETSAAMDSMVYTVSDGDPIVVVKRLDILEALLTGVTLPVVELERVTTAHAKPYSFSRLGRQLKGREIEFWYSAAQVAATRTTESAETPMTQCRRLLDTLENRDLMYSVMQMRNLSTTGEATSEEARHWAIAEKFLEMESVQAGSIVMATDSGHGVKSIQFCLIFCKDTRTVLLYCM